VARGQALYDQAEFDQALAAFEAAILRAPTAAVPRYNAAAALFQVKRFDEARERYLEARQSADAALRTKIDYALGNTALARGDIPGAIIAYSDCISSTARGAELDPVRQDAAINRAFAIEQAQSLAAPQGQGAEDSATAQRPDRPRAPNAQPGGDDAPASGRPEAGPEPGGTSTDDAEKSDGRNRLKRWKRPVGGAGGSRTTPPGSVGESPEDRLETALETLRTAEKRRLPDEPPPASAHDDRNRKDW
jgi:Ca-activated chloride channel family protein